MWDRQLPLLQAYYRVIRCDARGHGANAALPPPRDLDDLVDDAFAVMDAHNVPKASVMGLSLGGATALKMGLAAPERITRLVCCAPHAGTATGGVPEMPSLWDATVDGWLGDGTRASHPDREAALRGDFITTTSDGYHGCAGALTGFEHPRHLPMPALFVAGGDDPVATPMAIRAMSDACPGTDITVVPAARHMIPMDQPEGFAMAVIGFLGLEV
jgi:3-oxoadipate enol-lactonase